MRRLLSVILSLMLLTSCLAPVSFAANAATYAQQLKDKGFPDSYVNALVSLHNKYPNWNFQPFKTGLKWSDAVSGERSSHANQIIEKSGRSTDYFCKCSNCYKNGSYVARYGSGVVSASNWAVQYFMDPRNWLDEKHIFQFESNAYSSSQTQKGVEAIIANTWMKNSNISYVNTEGSTVTYKNSSGSAVKYSKAIMEAGEASGLSPYYLASRIVKEVGSTKPTASGTCGTKLPFKGMYNYYSIGANSGGMQGLEWASGFLKTTSATTLFSSYDSSKKAGSGTKTSVSAGQYMSYIGIYGNYFKVKLYTGSGTNSFSTNGKTGYILKSALRTTYFNYSRPWTSPYKSIYGGAAYIAASYKYQNTNYLQKFNVNKSSGNLYSHEYMANVDAVSKEAETTYKAYSNAGILKSARTFYIPVFNSMPASTKSANDFGKVANLRTSENTASSVTLVWNTQYSSKGYYVYKYTTADKKYTKIKTITSPYTNSVKITGLLAGTKYCFAVESYSGSSSGGKSALLTTATKPKKLNFKSLTAQSGGKLKAVWAKVSGASGYQIKYSRNSSFTKVVATKNVSGKLKTYTGKNFNKGVTYYIKIRAYKTVNGKKYYGAWSNVKKVKCK